jgi:hypothetical protein
LTVNLLVCGDARQASSTGSEICFEKHGNVSVHPGSRRRSGNEFEDGSHGAGHDGDFRVGSVMSFSHPAGNNRFGSTPTGEIP